MKTTKAFFIGIAAVMLGCSGRPNVPNREKVLNFNPQSGFKIVSVDLGPYSPNYGSSNDVVMTKDNNNDGIDDEFLHLEIRTTEENQFLNLKKAVRARYETKIENDSTYSVTYSSEMIKTLREKCAYGYELTQPKYDPRAEIHFGVVPGQKPLTDKNEAYAKTVGRVVPE